MFNTIQLVKASQTPLYLQLSNGLAQFIENGQLTSGTKLPSIRSLAKELKINRDTVVSAYKVLEQKGLTYGQTGRGTYVSPLPVPSTLTHSVLEPFSLTNKNLINFSTTSIPTDYCPIEIFEGIASNILLEEKWDSFYDYDGTKYQLLLEEVCKYFRQHSILSTPNQIRIVENIFQLIQALPKFTNKSGICVESPCKNISIFRKYGLKPFEVPLEIDGMNMDILEGYLKTQKIQYIYITPYLQNPTGICYSAQKKHQLITLAKQYNVYIIEEDTYSDLLLEDLTYLPIHSQVSNNHVIYIKNFSRLYLPKLSYSFVILPYSLININIASHPYNFTDSLFYHYLHNNMWQTNKEFLRGHYNEKYRKLLYLIDYHLSPYISYTCAFGGIYIWLTLDTPYITVEDLCDKLVANHVLVSPGSLFYTHTSIPPCIRISMAKLNMTHLERGVKIIASILDKAQNTSDS